MNTTTDDHEAEFGWQLRPTELAVLFMGIAAVVIGLVFSERRPGPPAPGRQPASACALTTVR